jgi:hypothetical protein
VGTLAHLRVDEYIDPTVSPAYNFDELNYAKVTVKGTGSAAELHIGRQDDKSKRFPVSISKDQGLGWISQSTANALLKKPTGFKTL